MEGVQALRARGYRPRDWYERDPEIRAVLDALAGDTFSPGEPGLFRPIVDSLLDGGDPYLCLADFKAYLACQDEVSTAWQDQDRWDRMAVLNTARSGKFFSDRTIRQYADEIWKVKTTPAG